MKSYLLIVSIIYSINNYSQIKILFDATKAETAGNADWIIDADAWTLKYNAASPFAVVSSSNNQSLAQRYPTPAQSGISASTSETFWTGASSAWAVDMVKKGYEVETLPYNVQITYGNTSNPQDLSNYKVYIVCEPNLVYSASEKTAIINFVKNGGGLFMISDHDVSDRNGDGWDSPHIWNDFMQNNTVQANPFGITFDYANISPTSSNVVTTVSDSLTHGLGGTVSQVKWSNGTTMTLNTTQNTSVAGDVFLNSPANGLTNVLVAHAHYFAGKVAAMGDSSPIDDGTGDPGDALYNGYFTDASGNHQKLLINTVIWLATSNVVTGIDEQFSNAEILFFPNPTSDKFSMTFPNSNFINRDVTIIDMLGRELIHQVIDDKKMECDLSNLKSGIYYIQIKNDKGQVASKKIIKN